MHVVMYVSRASVFGGADWRKRIRENVIWEDIGEFLQQDAPINHLFNQPETPS